MGEGEGGMIWENGTETCILSCKKRIASLCLMQDTGCLGLLHGDDPEDVGNLISGSSAFSKTSWNIWKFTVHVLLKPGLDHPK